MLRKLGAAHGNIYISCTRQETGAVTAGTGRAEPQVGRQKRSHPEKRVEKQLLEGPERP